MNPWKEPPDYPKVGDEILAELNGSENFQFMRFIVREGEGFGHIKRWQPLPAVLKSCCKDDVDPPASQS